MRVRRVDQREPAHGLGRAQSRAGAGWCSTFWAATRASAAGGWCERPERISCPPFSPDLNPIEMLRAKLKTLLRKAERRTVEGAWREVGRLSRPLQPRRVRRLSATRRIGSDNALTDSWGQGRVWERRLENGSRGVLPLPHESTPASETAA